MTEPCPPAPRARGSVGKLKAGVALALAAGFLITLRGTVFLSAGAGFSTTELLATSWKSVTGALAALGVAQLFLSSLGFELFVLLLLCGLARSGGAARWVARVGLLVLLWLNLAGTQVFLVLNTYAKGFQLTGLSPGEVGRMVGGFLGPKLLLALALPVVIALLFAREGSVERRRPVGRLRVLLAVFALGACVSVVQLLRHPHAVPALAHSPITLLLVSSLPERLGQVPQGTPAPEDWAPVTRLAPRWERLGEARRDFNVVVVVLESVRASVFWPAPDAPPMPRLAALEPHAAIFTRAYAHEPLSVKGLEALLFGIYPSPYWETVAGKWSDLPLESVAERWAALGMRNAFINYGELPSIGDKGYLRQHGFSHVDDWNDLRALEPETNDRTLVKALDRFIDTVPGQRFGAFLWPRQTHMPYQLPPPLKNAHPPNTYAAYRDTVEYLDLVIGDVVDVLKRRGLYERTVIALVADHGENFREQRPDGGSAHGDRLFESSAHIPLVLINPLLFQGERDERLVQQKDVAATLAWLAGDARPSLNVGHSVFHERTSETAYLISHIDLASMRGALVRGNLKYMYVAPVGTLPAREHLYDLAADPGETRDLWAERQEEGRALKARYFGWLRHWGERWGAVEHHGLPWERETLHRLLLGSEAPRVASPVE